MATGRRTRASVIVLVLGAGLAFLAAGLLYALDDTCPQWEDEGPMAAPRSPYSLVMCGPGAEPPMSWAWYAAVLLALLLVLHVVVRRPRRAAPWLIAAVLLPTLLVGALHLTLPRDCLSGRTESGDCSRDRETR